MTAWARCCAGSSRARSVPATTTPRGLLDVAPPRRARRRDDAPLRRRRRGRPGHRGRRRRRRVLAQRLARAGWRVVVLEAGPFWDPDTDWVSDEAGSHTPLLDPEAALSAATTPSRWARTTPAAASAARWCTTPATRRAFTPPTSPRTPATASAPTGRSPTRDLLPHYERWSASCRWPGRTGRGATRTATRTRRTRSPAAARSWCGRPALRDRDAGRPGRRSPTAVRQPAALHLPRLLSAGLQGQRQGQPATSPICPTRSRTASRSAPTAWRCGWRSTTRPARAAASTTPTTGRERCQRARLVAVAGYSIETPRLLLSSTSRRFPHGLGNNARPGRALRDGAGRPPGRGPLAGAAADVQGARRRRSRPSSSTRPTRPRGFARGFSIQTVSPLPIGWAEHVLADGHWGTALREYMRDYNHWAMLGVLIRAAAAPGQPGHARRRDRRVRPCRSPAWTTRQCDNDKANMAFSTKVMHDICDAGGAQDVLTIQRFAHLIGGARMGATPEDSVVDADHRLWDVPNVLVADGSVCPTQGSANPALTIMALSSRLADRLASGAAMDDDPAARVRVGKRDPDGGARWSTRERALTGAANGFSVSHLSWARVWRRPMTAVAPKPITARPYPARRAAKGSGLAQDAAHDGPEGHRDPLPGHVVRLLHGRRRDGAADPGRAGRGPGSSS